VVAVGIGDGTFVGGAFTGVEVGDEEAGMITGDEDALASLLSM